MSIEAINWAFKQDVIPASKKLVLLCLADFADDYGICWPRSKTIIKKTGVTKSTLFRVLKDLEKEGLIERGNRPSGDGSFLANVYRLASHTGRIDDHPMSSLLKSGWCQNGTTPYQDDTRVVSELDKGGAKMTPLEPSENHHINQKEKKRVPRDVFLLEINKRFKDGFFDDLEVTETNINTYGHMAYDHWEGYDKYPQGDVYTAFRGFVRIGQAENKLDRHIKKSTAKKSTYDPHSQWRARVSGWKKGLAWMSQWGAPPDDPETKVPTEVLEDFGIQQKAKETA